VDTEERVYTALQGLHTVASTVTITSRHTDTEEEDTACLHLHVHRVWMSQIERSSLQPAILAELCRGV
jgi:hypothetical protein